MGKKGYIYTHTQTQCCELIQFIGMCLIPKEREREPLISSERKGRKGKKSCIQIQFDHEHKKSPI
jgi:hypothetical protein